MMRFWPLILAALAAAPGPLPDAQSGVVHIAGPEFIYPDPGPDGRLVSGRGLADRFVLTGVQPRRSVEIFEDSTAANPDNRLVLPPSMQPSQVVVHAGPGGDLILLAGSTTIRVRHQFARLPGHRFGVQQVEFGRGVWSAEQLLAMAGPEARMPSGPEYRLGLGDADVIRIEADTGSLDILQIAASAHPHNVLQLGPGLVSKDADIWSYLTDDYLLTFKGSRPSIRLEHMLRSRADAIYGVQAIRFADGVVWTPASIIDRLNRVALTGVYGTLSDDAQGHVLDSHGMELLSRYRAFGGRDTIIYKRGYGRLSVEEQDTSERPDNVLQFGPGILPSDVTVTGYRHGVGGSALTLNVRSDGSVELENALNNRPGRTYGVQRVHFANGTVWTYADLLARAGLPPPNGASASERQPSLFPLKPGRSAFQGTGGGDGLLYERGIGVVTIDEPGLSPHRPNRLVFGGGIAPGSVTSLRAGSGDIYLDLGPDEGVLLSGERQASPPNDDAGVQIVTFADGTRWTKADLLRAAASNPLNQDKFAAQRRQRTEQANSAQAARAEAAAKAQVNAIYARFLADLHAGLDRIGIPADEADAILPLPMLRRYPDRPCRIAADKLMRRDSATISAGRRQMGTLADALDLKYGISDVDTAPDYMNPEEAITPINAMGMAVAALRDGRQARSPGSCTSRSR